MCVCLHLREGLSPCSCPSSSSGVLLLVTRCVLAWLGGGGHGVLCYPGPASKQALCLWSGGKGPGGGVVPHHCPSSSDETSSGLSIGRFLYPSPQLEGFFVFFFSSQLQSVFTFAIRVEEFSALSPKALKFLFHVRKGSGWIFMPFLLRWPPFSFRPALPRAAYSGFPSCPQFFLWMPIRGLWRRACELPLYLLPGIYTFMLTHTWLSVIC